jgi:hypothetical protein
MIRDRKILLILFLLSTLNAQNFINRLKVPIYYTSSFSVGYDSNIFRLSDLNLQVDNTSTIINSSTFDSGYIVPKLQVNYSPFLTSNIKTEFNFSFSRNHYFSSNEKSYNIFYTQLGFKLAPYQSIKISHRIIPKYYLRNYIDHDYSIFENQTCTFSIESFELSYSHPMKKKNWVKFRLSQINYLYNSNFTEFDTRIVQFKTKYYFRLLKLSNSIWYSFSDGDNISHDSGYFSTSINRSYEEHNVGLSLKTRAQKIDFIDNFGFSFMFENRNYKSKNEDALTFDSWEDALHNGRKHNEFNFSLWADKKINNKLNNQIMIKYRDRNIESNYYWVSDYKEFNKYEIIYKISFSSDLDLLY